MNLAQLFKNGQKYRQIFPQDRRLKPLFPETKIIDLIKLGNRFMPPAVVLIFVWQYYLNSNLILSLITAFFALSLPIQGIFWLGKRAQTPLPLNLLGWFNELTSRLVAHQVIGKKALITMPTFMDLVIIMNLAKLHLGDYFDLDDDNEA
ncbi:terminus macrodomain insulation protein YfbV [Utexia brackfieldae]|uniref:terminus macrodomain insulation protein YfbV n=1 Tax=Utexia brackfieldae TaxID=3074108 RepID=UPI00370DD502